MTANNTNTEAKSPFRAATPEIQFTNVSGKGDKKGCTALFLNADHLEKLVSILRDSAKESATGAVTVFLNQNTMPSQNGPWTKTTLKIEPGFERKA